MRLALGALLAVRICARLAHTIHLRALTARVRAWRVPMAHTIRSKARAAVHLASSAQLGQPTRSQVAQMKASVSRAARAAFLAQAASLRVPRAPGIQVRFNINRMKGAKSALWDQPHIREVLNDLPSGTRQVDYVNLSQIFPFFSST